MNSLRVDILNPKVRLLKDLADLNLIAIQETSKNSFSEVLKRLRTKTRVEVPSLEEISKEVEKVRAKRYAE